MNVDRDLSHTCSENKSLNADDIADIPLLELSELFLADIVCTDIALDAVGIVTDIDEVSLTHITPAHDTSGELESNSLNSVESSLDLFLVAVSSSDDDMPAPNSVELHGFRSPNLKGGTLPMNINGKINKSE